MTAAYSQHQQHAKRISAHRQTWFKSNYVNITARQRTTVESNIRSHDSQPNARWREDNAEHKTNLAIYDLVDAENVRARSIADAIDASDVEQALKLAESDDPPIKVINELLANSNIPIKISIQERHALVASKSGSEQFSIAELSDGERNALLIAANVLTAEAGTIIFIDEPERHLHQSIISSFFKNLFALRSDCAFVVSTHELMLPLDVPKAKILLVRSCSFDDKTAIAWDIDLVTDRMEIDDELKMDILGSRRKILFVEGQLRSLDKPLYSIIFPEFSIVSKDSCRQVEQAVSAIRDSDSLHWMNAFGIVDNDNRSEADVEELRGKGVCATPFISVESIYYHPKLQRLVANRSASVADDDPDDYFSNAEREALSAIEPHMQRLAERVAEQSVRARFLSMIPTKKDVRAGAPIHFSIDVEKIVSEELERIQESHQSGDFVSILACLMHEGLADIA